MRKVLFYFLQAPGEEALMEGGKEFNTLLATEFPALRSVGVWSSKINEYVGRGRKKKMLLERN